VSFIKKQPLNSKGVVDESSLMATQVLAHLLDLQKVLSALAGLQLVRMCHQGKLLELRLDVVHLCISLDV
jgi:hypothetical protein